MSFEKISDTFVWLVVGPFFVTEKITKNRFLRLAAFFLCIPWLVITLPITLVMAVVAMIALAWDLTK